MFVVGTVGVIGGCWLFIGSCVGEGWRCRLSEVATIILFLRMMATLMMDDDDGLLPLFILVEAFI